MHLTSALSARLSAVFRSTSTLAVASIHMPRQNDGVAIGDACFNMMLKDGVLKATCIAPNGNPKDTSKDLNQCLTNDRGSLRFTTSVANAFATCSGCNLDATTLKCSCENESGLSEPTSTINLDATKNEDQHGLLVGENGSFICV